MWIFKKPTPGKDDIRKAYNTSLSLQRLMKDIRTEKEKLFNRKVGNKSEVWRTLQANEHKAERLLADIRQKLREGIRKLR